MCTRMIPLTYDEAAAALDAREHTGRARVAHRDEFDPVHDAYPGSEVPTYILDSHGPLATVKLTWGFTLEGRPGAVFNTRIETALDQLRRDRLPGPLPRARPRVLRVARHRDCPQREDGKTGAQAVPHPHAAHGRLPPRGRAAGGAGSPSSQPPPMRRSPTCTTACR